MKKILSLILALSLLLALCACNASKTAEVPEAAPMEEPTPVAQEAEPVEEPAPENQEVVPMEEPAPDTQEAAPIEETAPVAQEAAPAEESVPEVQEAAEETSGGPGGEQGAFGGMTGGMFGGMMGGMFGGMSGGGSTDKSSDAQLQAMIAEVAPLFSVDTYTDEETGLTLEYNVYLPEGYDGSERYPMIVFIPDSSVVGAGAEAVLTQGWGALIWATEAEQAKHPCIVVAPVFTETILDDHSGYVTTQWVYLVPRMVETLAAKYQADTDRIYATGQSMGCMTMLITAAGNPDLFAAELFVDGQWDAAELTGLESQTFFYIAAGGDEKAVGGQDDVIAMLEADGVPYSYSDGWDAQAEAAELFALVEAELAEGNVINFIRWQTGTVLNGSGGMEHMASFDYAYKLEAVRDWLFEQSK